MNKNNKNKQKKAVAIGYEPGVDEAPKILAKGKGKTAERIEDVAREHDIPFHEDSMLADSLVDLDLGESIPDHLYDVVAQVLAFIYMLNEDWKQKIKKK